MGTHSGTKYFYIVCSKGWFGSRKPLKVFTNSVEAVSFCNQGSNRIIFKQAAKGDLEEYSIKT